MKLSLWILKDWLEELSPVIDCHSNSMDITGIRLYQKGMKMEPYALYVGQSDLFFGDGDKKILCMHKQDRLLLQTEDVFDVANRIQNAFSHYARWYDRCALELTGGCELSDLLALSAEILRLPILVVDAAQQLVAWSPYTAKLRSKAEWNIILERRTVSEERLKRYNLTNTDDVLSRKGIFAVSEDFFFVKSYCKHIFVHGERLATVILKAIHGDCSPGTLHLLELFSEFIQKWIESNAEKESTSQIISYLARTVDGNSSALPGLERQLSMFEWNRDCKKHLIVTSKLTEQLRYDIFMFRSLTNAGMGFYAIDCRGRLVILCNLDMPGMDAFSTFLCRVMEQDGCYAASSFYFTDLRLLPTFYQQCLRTLEHCGRVNGTLYSAQKSVLREALQILGRQFPDMPPHPALAALREFDAKNETKYYDTLYCYLRNERRKDLTAKKLFIHRNTLTQRLQKIFDLWPMALDDPDERLYLLFSFYLVQQSTE